MRAWVPVFAFFLTALVCAAAPGPDLQAAMIALQGGDSAGAEQKLRAELKTHPDEVEALSLLGVALDNQKKFTEANTFHQQAMAKAPASAGVLNNYGNHLLLNGDAKSAQEVFLKAVGIDPADGYANLQLAQIAIKSGRGAEALQYLDKVPGQETPYIQIMQLEALDLADKRAEAEALFRRLATATENDGVLSAILGRDLAQIGQFSQSEVFLTHALAGIPTDSNLQYQLGIVASRAGDNERARGVLEGALRRQPENPDVLYGLAFVYSAMKQPEQAVRLLSHASRVAPQRADIQKLLAVTTGDLLAYEDSVAAWDRYMVLAPDDDTGRRERGFAKSNMKQADGLADLEWYAGRHPDDATGLFELGVAQSISNPDQGLATLDKAVALKPDLVDAQSARGALNYQQGKAEAALPDLEFAAGKLPGSALVLDRLGQTYLLLDRPQDAVKVLRRAAMLAPTDSKTQLHLANALAQSGETAESKIFMNRYRELGGTAAVPARGVMDYLNLTPEQQHAAYKARVEKGIADKPDDASLQVAYLKLQIGDGQIEQAKATARKVTAMKPGSMLLTDAGRAMLSAAQYPLAKELLEQAGATGLELAIATFHVEGAAAGIANLDKLPPSDRGADYYSQRAQMLEAANKPDEAITAASQAVKSDPGRADLYWQAAVMMTKNKRGAEALALMDQAPEDGHIPVIRAAILELSGKTDDAEKVLNDAQHRWPEIPAIWVAKGVIAAAHGRAEEGRKALATAASLGANTKAAIPPAQLFLSKPPQDW